LRTTHIIQLLGIHAPSLLRHVHAHEAKGCAHTAALLLAAIFIASA
jgi:hypothetical protein